MSYPDPRHDGTSYPKTKYFGDTGEVSAWLRRADAPAELDTGSGFAHYLATGAQTNGQFGLTRWDMGPEPSGPAPHFHRTMSESFFVLSGSVRIFDGRDWVDTGPGDYCFVPEGGIHGFRNESGEAASMLILFAPGAPREQYFEGLREMFRPGREVSAEEFTEFCERHDNIYL
jgi:mannose-6-phosphate isomerase-like protein (cupin superfamily)